MDVFAVKDKTNRNIYLSKERWVHIQKHPECTLHFLERMKDTLVHPDTIQDFEFDPRVHFYYRRYADVRGYLFISVKYLNGKGFIITSFYTDKIT